MTVQEPADQLFPSAHPLNPMPPLCSTATESDGDDLKRVGLSRESVFDPPNERGRAHGGASEIPMSRFVYRVYYDERTWPNKGDSLASRKNDRQMAAALENFPADLRVRLCSSHPNILVAPKDRTTIEVWIVSDRPDAEVLDAVKWCLDRHQLFGDRLC